MKALSNKEYIYSILCPHCKTSFWEGNQSSYLLRIPSSSPVIDRSCVYPRPSSSNRIGFVAQDFCLLVFFPTFISAISPLKNTNKLNLHRIEVTPQIKYISSQNSHTAAGDNMHIPKLLSVTFPLRLGYRLVLPQFSE